MIDFMGARLSPNLADILHRFEYICLFPYLSFLSFFSSFRYLKSRPREFIATIKRASTKEGIYKSRPAQAAREIFSSTSRNGHGLKRVRRGGKAFECQKDTWGNSVRLACEIGEWMVWIIGYVLYLPTYTIMRWDLRVYSIAGRRDRYLLDAKIGGPPMSETSAASWCTGIELGGGRGGHCGCENSERLNGVVNKKGWKESSMGIINQINQSNQSIKL